MTGRFLPYLKLMDTQKYKHTDNGKTLPYYRYLIYCNCPNCNSLLIVKGESNWYLQKARATCLTCSFAKEWSANDWRGPVVGYARRPCSSCGHRWLTACVQKEQYSPQMKQTADLKCPRCSHVMVEKLEWHADRVTKEGYDPYFGFKLYLQSSCCDELLWVYNSEHLEDLYSYVRAAIRERNGTNKWSMITRLPSWIKKAENRKEILKCLDKFRSLIPATAKPNKALEPTAS